MTMAKVCGITEVEHALVAAEEGADFVGLVFAPSRRRIDVDRAHQIVRTVKELEIRPEVVGVFVNLPATEVNRMAEDLSLDWVQLSGDEDWEYCQGIEKPIIKAVHISEKSTGGDVTSTLDSGFNLLAHRRLIVLLDTRLEGMYGGTAQTFNWQLVREMPARFPVMVAGGLTPQNVTQAIRTARPWGVDASSGLESGGVKDSDKIRMFMRAVRREDEAI